MNSEFKKQFSILKTTIENQYDLTEFKLIEKMLSENERVEKLITRIKILQKKIIFLEKINKTSYIHEVEKEIIEIEKTLLEIPLYVQYKERKKFLDNELQNINDYINEKLNEKIVEDKKEAQNYE